jgi:hypothetical protein
MAFLAYSGALFELEQFDVDMMLAHKYAGLLLLVLTLVHIFMKRNKVKKITEEFIALLMRKNIKHTNNKEELLELLKTKSLEEFALLFHLDIQDVVLMLEQNSIEVSDTKEKLNKIAKSNSKDLYQIFILLLKEHIKKS